MMEVAGEDFGSQPLSDRIILDDVEQEVRRHLMDVHTEKGFSLVVEQVGSSCVRARPACRRSVKGIWGAPMSSRHAFTISKSGRSPVVPAVWLNRTRCGTMAGATGSRRRCCSRPYSGRAGK